MAPNKKMGRPTDDPKIKGYRLRLSAKDDEILTFCAEKTGKPKSEILKMGLYKVYSELKKE